MARTKVRPQLTQAPPCLTENRAGLTCIVSGTSLYWFLITEICPFLNLGAGNRYRMQQLQQEDWIQQQMKEKQDNKAADADDE